jgi:hypothetical protein
MVFRNRAPKRKQEETGAWRKLDNNELRQADRERWVMQHTRDKREMREKLCIKKAERKET